MKITYGATVPAPPHEAFAFISEPDNWPSFFPEMTAVVKNSGWGQPGGTATVTTRLLGRTGTSVFELTAWDPPRMFRYTARTSGRPDLVQNRVFSASGDGTRFVGTTEMTPRPGAPGTSDRLFLLAVKRMMTRGMRRLPEALRTYRVNH